MVRHRGFPVSIIIAAAAVAWSSAQTERSAFDVASVKRVIGGRFSDIRFEFLPTRLIARHVPLRSVIAVAYIDAEPDAVVAERVIGGPAWMDTDMFDIEGATDIETPRATMTLMLRRLLQERFSLKAHSDKRQGPAYAVLANRSDRRPGPQLRTPTVDCNGTSDIKEARQRRCGSGTYVDKEDGAVVVYGADYNVDQILGAISAAHVVRLDKPLINRTELDGRFSFELRFSREATASPAGSGIAFFTALQQQLGFKVEQVTAPIGVLVIDSVQQPTEN
jgi:uncharacterized protein (TIGR03435 family)